MSLPATAGLATNINVQIQVYGKDLDSYIKLSESQMKDIGFTIVEAKRVSPTEWKCQYTGNMGKNPMYWYTRAVWKDGTVYLTTSTTTEKEWPALKAQLTDVVDSFKLTQ